MENIYSSLNDYWVDSHEKKYFLILMTKVICKVSSSLWNKESFLFLINWKILKFDILMIWIKLKIRKNQKKGLEILFEHYSVKNKDLLC